MEAVFISRHRRAQSNRASPTSPRVPIYHITEATSIELWDSILDYFFINHTLRPGTLARRSPFRSSHQPAELLSEVDSLHRITTDLI